MSKIWIPGSGGGADLDVTTAQAEDILAGKVIVDPDGEPLTGTMPNNGAASKVLPINGSYTIPVGYHNGSGKVTQSIPVQGGSTTIPGTANKTIVAANRYVNGNIIVAGDPNLQAGNIKKGVSIFGKTGTFEGYTTSPLYLFNNGNWGGLQTTRATKISSYASGDCDKLLSNKFVWGHTGYGSGSIVTMAMWRLNQSFNLSQYKYIKVVQCSVTANEVFGFSSGTYQDGYVCVGVATSAITSTNAPSSITGTPSGLAAYKSGTGTVVLDVSNLNGNYWICFGGINDQGKRVAACGLNQLFVSNT